jgi:hypothetical protein
MEPIMEPPGSRRPAFVASRFATWAPAADLRVLSVNADSEIGVKDDQRLRWRPLVVERPTCLRRDLSLLRLDLRHEGVEIRRVDTNRPKLVDVEWNSVLRADAVDGWLPRRVPERKLVEDVGVMEGEVGDVEPCLRDVLDHLRRSTAADRVNAMTAALLLF